MITAGARGRMGHTTKVALLAVAALISGGVLAACRDPEPVRIGFAGGLTGRVADLGISGRNGATLAVEMRNAAGGVLGRPVELHVRDDEQDPEVAVRVDRELADLGVEAIVGHMTSAMSVAAVPEANRRGIPLVSPTTTTAELTGIDDQFIRVTSTTAEYGRAMAEHLHSIAGIRVVGIVYDRANRPYCESWIESFRVRLEELGGSVARLESFDSKTEVHFEPLAESLIAPGIDGLVIISSALDAAMISQQVRKLGSRLPLAVAGWASTEKLLVFGGAAVEGVVVSQFFDRESTHPAYLRFREAYRERFGEEPGFGAVNAFDAANVVLAALEGRRNGEDLREAVVRIGRFEGVQGPLDIDRFGEASRRNHLAIVESGAFRVVEAP